MASHHIRPIVLISGANKGIGLAAANILASQHGYHVIVGSRSGSAGEQVAASIRAAGHAASSVQLDLDSESSINAAVQTIDRDFGRLDVLINNAAVFADPLPWVDRPALGAFELFSTTFSTNVVGTAVLTEGLLPLLRRAQAKPARIVFVTGRLASLTYALGDKKRFPNWRAYSASKAAVNMLTIKYAELLEDDGFKVNVVDPGLVDTDLSGHAEGSHPPEVGAISLVRMATLGEDGPTATFSDRDGLLAW
jgi:NAD(P)-dependent dehydrogenase (short-subunit alcohol dehydrogenase family)